MTSSEYNQKRQDYLEHRISHDEFYLWVAEKIGWTFKAVNMGHGAPWWAEKYAKDEHLNNVSLQEFDAFYPTFQRMAQGKGIWIAPADCVCTMKALIKAEVLKS